MTEEQEEKVLEMTCLSVSEEATIIIMPVGINLPSHMCNVGDLPAQPPAKIEEMIWETIKSDDTKARLVKILRELPGTKGAPDEVLIRLVLGNISLELLDAHTAGGFADPSYNIYLKPVSASVAIWQALKDLFNSLRYRNPSIGEGRVKKVSPCHGCHGTDHFSGMCTWTRANKWRGGPARMQAPSKGPSGHRGRMDRD